MEFVTGDNSVSTSRLVIFDRQNGNNYFLHFTHSAMSNSCQLKFFQNSDADLLERKNNAHNKLYTKRFDREHSVFFGLNMADKNNGF